MIPDLIAAHEVPGFLDFLIGLVPSAVFGFLLSALCGLVAFGIFGLFRLLKRLI